MGKDLKGKELGEGISQRKDGYFTARYTGPDGKRKQKYFNKIQECRKWLVEQQDAMEHGSVLNGGEMTVSAWFEYWYENIAESRCRYNTLKSYRNRFKFNIDPAIGKMYLKDVKPIHCQHVLNTMGKNYSNKSIKTTRVVLHLIFEDAVENELILTNPVKKSVKYTNGKTDPRKEVLTRQEQKVFMDYARDHKSHKYVQFGLVLQTGLRCGEVMGLKWDDIDFDKAVLHVRRSLEWDTTKKEWIFGEPKSRAGVRDIPLTAEAIRLLRIQQEKDRKRKIVPVEFAGFVFLTSGGEPVDNHSYNQCIYRICKRVGLERFSMHALRRTFATRCAEAGMTPKTLQMIMGHSNINVTMGIYVHCTEEQKSEELKNVEKSIQVV